MTERCAAQRLPNLDHMPRREAEDLLRRHGFGLASTTPGGYARWRHPDGSHVWIRPDGEIVRVPNAAAIANAGLIGKGWRVDADGTIVRPHSYEPERTTDQAGAEEGQW